MLYQDGIKFRSFDERPNDLDIVVEDCTDPATAMAKAAAAMQEKYPEHLITRMRLVDYTSDSNSMVLHYTAKV